VLQSQRWSHRDALAPATRKVETPGLDIGEVGYWRD
jgi:hypothetical protein